MLDYAQLAAVASVVQTGSFEKAARQLGVTPSAISQRVRLLEDRLGVPLIIRGQPCTATPAGSRLCRHANDVGLLENALLGDLIPAAGPAMLRIAINADSLATWFIDAMAATRGILFDLVIDDQDYSADWLKRGEVCAAVTSIPRPPQGCASRRLGRLRYLATASPAFIRRWFAEGVSIPSLTHAPCLRFNAKDELQAQWMEAFTGRKLAPPSHWLPSSGAFVDGALAGLGWGMNPENSVRRHIAEGRLVELIPSRPLDVALYWQWSRSLGEALAGVTAAVLEAARNQISP